jgi:hypothetical protein
MHGIIGQTQKESLVAGKLGRIKPVQAKNAGDEQDNINFPVALSSILPGRFEEIQTTIFPWKER